MDRLHQLTTDLDALLRELDNEAARVDARSLMAPLAWLDEANGWLRYELQRLADPDLAPEEPPFTYIPMHLRR